MYLARLIFQMPQNKSTKFMESVIFTLYNYASTPREAYLLLQLFKAALQEEIRWVAMGVLLWGQVWEKAGPGASAWMQLSPLAAPSCVREQTQWSIPFLPSVPSFSPGPRWTTSMTS